MGLYLAQNAKFRVKFRGNPSGPLTLSPPVLTSPTTINVTDAYLTANNNTVNLYGAGQDWIINLPTDVALTNPVTIHGQNQARNIVLIGGAILPTQKTDLSTMMRDGDYAVYALRGFTGATGGTFRVGPLYANGPYTADLAYNADAPTIKSAIEAVLGTGTVFAVSGTGVGGPWKFVPNGKKMGRPGLDLTNLTGTVSAYSPATNVYNPASGGLILKQWTGTCHIEGLDVGGPYCDEAMDVQNQFDNAIVQYANVHSHAEYFQFHPDWHHGDGLQCYLGPCELRAERSDFISSSTGSGLIAQPRETASPSSLQGLRDWWFKNTLFGNFGSTIGGYMGAPIIMEDDWPTNNSNTAGWQWTMSGCYASRTDDGIETVNAQELNYFSHYPLTVATSLNGGTGLTIKAKPASGIMCDPVKGQCGVGYVTPGYTGTTFTPGTKRLQGETKLT